MVSTVNRFVGPIGHKYMGREIFSVEYPSIDMIIVQCNKLLMQHVSQALIGVPKTAGSSFTFTMMVFIDSLTMDLMKSLHSNSSRLYTMDNTFPNRNGAANKTIIQYNDLSNK